MNKEDAQALLESTKLQILKIRTCSKEKGAFRTPTLPSSIDQNISNLLTFYSKAELSSMFSITYAQIDRSVMKAKKLQISNQFIDISSSIPKVEHSIGPTSNAHGPKFQSLILEIKTKSGNIISVYE